MAYQKDPDEIGALWAKDGPKGKYLSGTIDGIGAVVCFRTKSDNPKAPAFRVLRAKKREERDEKEW